MSVNKKYLIILDIDGTLLNSDGKITELTKDILLKLQSLGHKLVLASGRSFYRLQKIAAELEMVKYGGYFVEINGNCLYDVANDKRIRLFNLDFEQLKYICSVLPDDVELTFNGDCQLFHIIPDEIFKLKMLIRKEMKLPPNYPWSSGSYGWFSDLSDGYYTSKVINNLSEIDCVINKMTLSQNEDYIDKFYPWLKKKFKSKFQVALISKRQIEITHIFANKGLGLRSLIDYFNLGQYKTIAFGDSGNDLDLIGVVDVFVAMGNCLKIVSDSADFMTDSHDNDGIYKFLKTYIKEG